jgi:hypothetical protein
MMNSKWISLCAAGMALMTFALLGCKSGRESAGDKFLKAGDALNAVVQYEMARQEKVSKEFLSNYTKANIMVMRARAAEDPTADMVDAFHDSILSLIKQQPDAANEAAFSEALVEIGAKRIEMGTPQAEEGGLRLLRTAEGLPGKAASVAAKVAQVRSGFIANRLKEIESDLSDGASDPQQGILAEYKMNQLQLMVGEGAPELKDMWSKVRKQNLSTYLMFDLEGLVERVDARINKYGMLIGIVKYTPGANTSIQAKVWNGSSGPAEFDGSNFRLVDRAGNAYKSGTNLGAFKKKTLVPKGDESKTGGLSFAVPAGAEPDYLELTVDNRVTRKYLP